jgi:hypothetical protein
MLGRNVEEDEEDRTSQNRNFNILFTGAVKEDLLKTIRPS